MAWPTSKGTQTELETFAGTLCYDLDAATNLTQFVNDVIDELGKKSNPPFVSQAFEKVTATVATYSYETLMIRPVAIFYNDQQLSEASDADLQAYTEGWADDTGTPHSFTESNITARTYKLYPIPDTTGATPSGWDNTFVVNNISIFYSEDRSTDIESYYLLPIAFDALFREFSYPSDHNDQAFASVCSEIAAVLYRLAGVE